MFYMLLALDSKLYRDVTQKEAERERREKEICWHKLELKCFCMKWFEKHDLILYVDMFAFKPVIVLKCLIEFHNRHATPCL